MNWHDLISEVASIGSAGSSDAPVSGIEYDSRRVRPGSVFVAMKGGSTDGNRYVDLAAGFGALLLGHRPEGVAQQIERQSGRATRS